jgi:NADPH2:quinone reductase
LLVVVVGATGTAGIVAVQAAKLLGARHVVAVGRRQEALDRAHRLGADATLKLTTSSSLAEELLEACAGLAPTYIYDPLWGDALVAALELAAPRARVVQLGQAANAEVALSSALIRGKDIDLLGYTNLNLPFDELAEDYGGLLEHVIAGRIEIEVERVPLADAPQAWSLQVAARRPLARPPVVISASARSSKPAGGSAKKSKNATRSAP